MAGYRVSYRVLRQQGEDIKAVAKMVDSYTQRLTQINSKLGNDQMLSEIRGNLNKLREQLGESRAVLNTSGELLIKSVESYGGVEVRQVKKVDGMKAHNRDFYKNPVAVASAGGGGGGAAAAANAARATPSTSAASATSATTVNYTDNSIDNSTNINIGTADPAFSGSQGVSSVHGFPETSSPQTQASAQVNMQPMTAKTGVPVSSETTAPGVADTIKAKTGLSDGVVGAAVGAVGGAAVATGAIFGGSKLKKKSETASAAKDGASDDDDEYDPAAKLEETLDAARGEAATGDVAAENEDENNE